MKLRSVTALVLLVGCGADPETVDALQAEVDALRAEAEARQAELDALSDRVDDMASSDTVAGLSGRVTDLEEAGFATEAWVAEQGLDEAIADNAARIEANATAAAAASAASLVNAEDIEDLQAVDETHSADIAGNAAEIGSLSSDLSSLDADVASLDAALLGVTSDVADHAVDLADHRTDIDTLTSDLASVRTTVSTQGGSIAVNTAGVAANKASIGDLEADVTDVASDIGDLEDLVTVQYARFDSNVGWKTGSLAGNGRTVSVSKQRSDTVLHVTYTDNFYDRPRVGCTWEVRFDGRSCTSPGAIAAEQWSDDGTHTIGSIEGVCEATAAGPLTSGTHKVEVHARLSPGYSSSTPCYTGWRRGGSLIVRELLK